MTTDPPTPAPVPVVPAPASPAPPPPAPSASAPAKVAAPVAKPAPAPPPPRPARVGDVLDRGVSRRDTVRAQTWQADGLVKVTGEVDVGTVRLEGTISVAGAVTADTLSSRGTLETNGAVTISGALSTDGQFHVGGSLTAHDATLRGTARIERDVTVERTLHARGPFSAASVRAGEFHVEGSVDVPGAIDAVDVTVRLRHDSRFGIIRARSVSLVRTPPNPIERVFGRSEAPKVTRIEADRVELEGVNVDFVRSPEVILGRGAHVTELEGTIVRRHASASVGPRSQTHPPHGLSR